MTTVIILEGPDGCGKTNIANALSKKLSIPVFKSAGEWKHFEELDEGTWFLNTTKYSLPYLLEFIQQTNTSVILDRAYPSEYVYGPMCGRETDFNVLKSIDTMCKQMSVKIVLLHRSFYNNVIDQFDIIDESFLNSVHNGYENFKSWTSCDVLSLNVDDENLDRELTEILDFVEEK
jgi:thymidylate kinase